MVLVMCLYVILKSYLQIIGLVREFVIIDLEYLFSSRFGTGPVHEFKVRGLWRIWECSYKVF